ncbi:unnamed protein product [Adineta steineri]|uniref:AIG1-type G domain-containing protein n=1 Tax=Adineta steineri TaxID=433720 RepID=A0A818P952_9BILA|nr:unnamed protein product [Adineta steineri]CAF3615690.1 unnamed protein product [Adineta steineri]
MLENQIIERKAIDSFGILGSLYDGNQDQIIKQHYINSSIQSSELSHLSSCIIEKGHINKNFNLLQFIGIQDELRLHLLLNLAKRVGIASILNYSRRINEYTRFLYFSSIIRKEQIIITLEQIQQLILSSNLDLNATHIIRMIDFGIEFIAILQLPYEINITQQIDTILDKIRLILLNNNNTLILTNEEETILEKLINITTYSNISSLMTVNRVSDLFYQINRLKISSNHCHPLTYYLQSIDNLDSPYSSKNILLKILSADNCKQIEEYILQFRIPIKYLEASVNQHMPNYLYGHLQNRIYHVRQQYSILKDIYMKKIHQLTKLLTIADKDQFDMSMIFQELNFNEQNSINQLLKDVYDLENEIQIENNLRKKQLNDDKISEQDLNENDNFLNTNSTANITSDYDPDGDDTSSQSSNNTNDNEIDQTTLSDDSFIENDLPVSNEIINILLLGETGVGKSTFINSLVNYLHFNRLDQAQSNKPIAIIPVSFLLNNDEQLIEYNDLNESTNENFNYSGQSVTQHCKSYIFHLYNGNKLCIIDTPGFGDVRGIDQDNFNMEHILKYINNLTHINAICFLCKPNLVKLNQYFQSCFIQLFDFFGKNISENFIFCFTNTRSTSYTPDDTISLFQPIFDLFSLDDISLQKENIFCFDNESFRYLIALQNGISFNNNDIVQYETSWKTSTKESNRLIKYICTGLNSYSLQNRCQSIKHAQFQILHLIRPILETIRNIFRNITLWNIESPNQSIELYSTVIHHLVYSCLSCNPKIIKIGNFGIINDFPHEMQNKCQTCQCSPNRHIQIEYLLNYKLLNRPSKNKISEMKEQLLILRNASVQFAYFLKNIAYCTKENVILVNLIRIIEQETYICRHSQTNYLNVQLIKELTQWKQKYEEYFNEIIMKNMHNDLGIIYESIERVENILIIKEQLDAIKMGQEIMMKQHEIQAMQI